MRVNLRGNSFGRLQLAEVSQPKGDSSHENQHRKTGEYSANFVHDRCCPGGSGIDHDPATTEDLRSPLRANVGIRLRSRIPKPLSTNSLSNSASASRASINAWRPRRRLPLAGRATGEPAPLRRQPREHSPVAAVQRRPDRRLHQSGPAGGTGQAVSRLRKGSTPRRARPAKVIGPL